MAKTANDLISDALKQTGLIPQEADGIQSYMTMQGLQLLNDIIVEWGGIASQIPYNNPPIEFNMVANQDSYTFGNSESFDVDTNPIIDIITMVYDLDPATQQINVPLDQMSEMEYSNINYRKLSVYPSKYLLRLYPAHSEIIIQPRPQLAFPTRIVAKQRLQVVELYEDLEVQFPPSFLLCLKYRLCLDLADANGFEMSQSFQAKAQRAMSQMKGNNKMDLTVNATESFSKQYQGGWFLGVPWQ